MKRIGGSSKTKGSKGAAVAGAAQAPQAGAVKHKPTPEAKAYFDSLEDPTVVEMVRTSIKDAHVFKLPPRPGAGGWRGADWRDADKIWVGTVRVVERANTTSIVLLDTTNKAASSTTSSENKDKISNINGANIFAVCPYREGAVDRCVDSSRYFVLRVESKNGQHMFVGLAFNERNAAFDFNTALQDSMKERQAELRPPKGGISSPSNSGPKKDYSLKQGQKIHVNISKLKLHNDSDDEDGDQQQGTDAKMKSVDKTNAAPKPSGFKKLMGKSSDTNKGASKIVKRKPSSNKKVATNSALSPPSTDSMKPSHKDTVTEAFDMFGSAEDDDENVDFGGFTADFAAFPTNAL
jgi:hypothetical protein